MSGYCDFCKIASGEGVNVVQCNERAAFQSVRHFHVHVIPRFRGDAIARSMHAMLAPMGFEKATRQELDGVAERIRQNLQRIFDVDFGGPGRI